MAVEPPAANPATTAKSAGTSAVSAAKRIPTWAWIVIIGGGIIVGVLVRRSQSRSAEPAADPVAAPVPAASAGYDSGAYQTDLPTPPVQYSGNVFSPGDNGGVATAAPAVPGPTTVYAPTILTGGGTPPPPVSQAPPAPPPSLPAGYTRGDTAYGKRFPGAIGWAVVTSGGSGKTAFKVIHVRYANGRRLERWRVRINTSPRKWSLEWRGTY